MPRLFQLANGNWIDLNVVWSVEAAPGLLCTVTGVRHAPRVIVRLREQFCQVIDCESAEDADNLRDEIASKVNEQE